MSIWQVTRVVRWTEDKLKDLDAFLAKHPKTKRIALAVVNILIYIWLNMTFTVMQITILIWEI